MENIIYKYEEVTNDDLKDAIHKKIGKNKIEYFI